jgi:hypothetical protein
MDEADDDPDPDGWPVHPAVAFYGLWPRPRPEPAGAAEDADLAFAGGGGRESIEAA